MRAYIPSPQKGEPAFGTIEKSIDLRSDDQKLTSCGFLIRADKAEPNENTADLRQDYDDYYTEYEDYEEEDEDLVCCHKADVVAPEETDCANLEDHVYVNKICYLKIQGQYFWIPHSIFHIR